MRTATIHGEMDRSALLRHHYIFENDHERTLNVEYYLKRPLVLPDGTRVSTDEYVKRGAHVRLKEWPDGMEGHLAEAVRTCGQTVVRSRGITPSGMQPGEAAKKLLRLFGRGVRFANTQAMTTAFKVEILNGSHAFGAQAANGTRTVTTKDNFKMALFLASATRNASDTVYNTTGELAGTGNYTQGGNAVTNATAPNSSGTTAFWTPSASVSWSNLTSSGAFDAAVLYNDSATNKNEVAVFTFGSQNISASTFTLTMPTNDASTGLIRIA